MNNPSQLPEKAALGRYRIIKTLGQGGMGTVYLAHDPKLDRNVALKVPKLSGDEDPSALSRFFREARAVASLRHPNLCPVYDVIEEGSTCYFTMSYIEGPSLSSYTSAENLLPQRLVAVAVCKVARGVHAAHRKGVIHRDIKPSNIMIDREHSEPVVMDFGLARSMRSDESHITHLGRILGTPAYMSPEQVEGDVDQIGPGTDIYSLGVVMYQLLTGRLPFEGPVTRVLALIQTQTPEPPSRHRADLDPKLDAICQKAMAKRVIDRFHTMSEFADALSAYVKLTKESPSPFEPASTVGTSKAPGSNLETQSIVGDAESTTLPGRIRHPRTEPLSDLGFGDKLRSAIQELVSRGSGVLLACGPPASGTTTTACAMLRSIDAYQHTILSLADPAGHDIPDIEAYQPEAGDSPARSIHRCAHLFEPDIMFLDPIRAADAAGAMFTCRHPVILVSEFVAADAAAGILQLIQWTGQPQLVADRLLGICSQRLIRRLCSDCKEPFRPNPAVLSKIGLPQTIRQLYRTPRSPEAFESSTAGTCPGCGGNGYAGRTGLFELILMSDAMRQLVSGAPTAAAIRAVARSEKMLRFQDGALKLVLDGETSVDELRRVFKKS